MASFQFKSQENLSLRQRVATDIRNAIIHGDLKPGDKLKELEISEQMGISRGPIREALRDLEAMGLVVSLPYRETAVADVHKEEIIDLLIPVRLQLELYAIKYNLDIFDEALFNTLDAIVGNMSSLAGENDLFGLIEEDIRFHEQIISFNESAYTKQIWASIVNRLRLHFIKNTRQFTDLNRVSNDHALLLEALKTKDFPQIALQWTEHIHNEDCLLCFSAES
ncbi:GntR family transcriptional regulator [Paenibacillus eucommiae]|uniref:DNA-binding GntR family transcriptional regulator n=1 Tax=Paenibacillus eucommiae TaxID=1355755 RepID=A0ABS4J420_9BACL|nr:GntR family transcriptional regulator [Paenibacillus eucommiae]MBP1994030.1 DNA-binding GntR family transcriptional regulator [Paenibacillus eucommiae]